MDPLLAAAFLTGAAIGSYFQAHTGFALNIIVLTAASLVDGSGLFETTVALSVMSLVNIGTVLPKIWKHINWRQIRRIFLGLTPGLVIGLALLTHLNQESTNALKLLAGVSILGSALLFVIKPSANKHHSRNATHGYIGLFSGLLTGLFSIGGPPLVLHLYRQDATVVAVKSTLLAIFGLAAAARLLMLLPSGQVSGASIKIGLISVPVVFLASWLYLKFPPAISAGTTRRIVFVVLAVAGLMVVVNASRALFFA